eukprot:Opistho-2@82329
MSYAEICETVLVPAHIDAVFDFYTDHVGWPAWTSAGSVALEKEGTPNKNGVGCIRAITTAGVFTVREEVLTFERPHNMTYRVLSGMPVMSDHLGEVAFEECDVDGANGEKKRGTRIVWKCRFLATFGFGWAVVPVARNFFRSALDNLAAKFAAEQAQSTN